VGLPVLRGHAAFASIFLGEAAFSVAADLGCRCGPDAPVVPAPRTIVYGDSDEVSVRTHESGAHVLLVSDAPVREPIAP